MAKLVDVGSIGSYFESLSDPRQIRKHLLVDIAGIAVCGIICGWKYDGGKPHRQRA